MGKAFTTLVIMRLGFGIGSLLGTTQASAPGSASHREGALWRESGSVPPSGDQLKGGSR